MDEMNKSLHKLSLDIIPTPDYIQGGTAMAQKIIETLQKNIKPNRQYKIARQFIAGSCGKHTSIFDSDFDCVLLINDVQPPFKDNLLNDFEHVILLHTRSGIKISKLEVTGSALRLTADGYDIDVVAAPNCILHQGQEADSDTTIKLQQERTLKIIRQDPEKYNYMYSSGLVEAHLHFMKGQSSFTHEMVRLAKYWYKTVNIGESPSGGKTLIEIVAVYCSNIEEGNDSRSYFQAFKRFLEKMKEFSSLNIICDSSYKIEGSIQNQRPLVLEPSNPFNNMAAYWTKSNQIRIQEFAGETLRHLTSVECVPPFSQRNTTISLEKLFEPQPRIVPGSRHFALSNALISTHTSNVIQPGREVRGVDKMDPVVESYLKNIQDNLLVVMRSFISSHNKGNTASLEKVMERVQKCVDDHITGTPSKWSFVTKTHEDFDVTFTVPIVIGQENYCIKYSANINFT